MYTWENAIITRKGLALLSKLTSGNTLYLTRAASGSGFVDPDILVNMNAMSNEKQSMTFATQSYPEEGKCAVPVRLTNTGLSEGYQARQVGIYAFDPDEDEILFLIAQAMTEEGNPEPKGTKIPSESEMPGYSAEWTFYIEYGQADDVTVVVDPSNTITEKAVKVMIDNHNNSSNPHPGVLATKTDLNNHANSKTPHAGVLATEEDLRDHVNSKTPHDGVLATAVSLNNHVNNKNNPHGVTAKQLGLDKVNNTPDSEKNVAFASEAAAARKVNYSLVVRFQGGNTEGTDKWTFDGSTSRSINITPEKIGASEVGHTHIPEEVGLVPLEDIPNLYVWKRYNGKPSNEYAEKEMTNVEFKVATTFLNHTTSYDLYYGSSFTVDEENGKFVLSTDGYATNSAATLKEKIGQYPYIRHSSDYDYLYHVPSDAEISERTETAVNGGSIKYITISKATKLMITELYGYKASKESDAYPANGEHTDGFWYIYHKQLGE